MVISNWPLPAPCCFSARPAAPVGRGQKRVREHHCHVKEQEAGAPRAAAATPPHRSRTPGCPGRTAEWRETGRRERRERARGGPARPAPGGKGSPCNTEAHRSGLSRRHWSARSAGTEGTALDSSLLSRAAPVRPRPKGSPPAGPGPRRASGRPLQPQLRRRTGEGRHLRPVLRDSARGPSLRKDTRRGSGRRFRPPPPARVCRFPSPGKDPVPKELFRPKKRPAADSTARTQFSCPLLFLGSQDPSSSDVLRVTFYVGHAVCHQEHFSTCKEADVTWWGSHSGPGWSDSKTVPSLLPHSDPAAPQR